MKMFQLVAACLAVVSALLTSPAHAADQGNMVYSVKQDDTLVDLGRNYLNSSAAAFEVQKMNRLRNPRRIPVGTRLVIPRRLLRFQPIDLKVQAFSGPVITNGAQVSKGLNVPEGRELSTGVNGFVTLVGSEGSRFSLPSNSRVRIALSRRYLINAAADIELEILAGRADVSAAKQTGDSQFRLRTPVAVSAVRGTQFRVAYNPETASGLTEVIEGAVAVNTASRNVELAAGFGAAALQGGGLNREALLVSPAAIDPGKVQTSPAISFALKPQDGAAAYRLQIAKDAGFIETIAEQTSAQPQASFDAVPNGRLFMRASAIAASGLEGMPDVWSFRRQQLGIKASASPLGDGYRMDWLAEGDGTSLYRFQMFKDGNLDMPLIDETGLEQPGLTLTDLKRGSYQWRVSVTQTTPDGSAEVWTPLQKFTVSD